MSKIKKYQVRDHCHYTGEYRGAVHSICNLRCSVPKKIPIAFDNRSKILVIIFWHFLMILVRSELPQVK